jgi:hypothetical protein
MFDFPRGGEHGTRAPLITAQQSPAGKQARGVRRAGLIAVAARDARPWVLFFGRGVRLFGISSRRAPVGSYRPDKVYVPPGWSYSRGRSHRLCRRRKLARRVMTSFGIMHTGRI